MLLYASKRGKRIGKLDLGELSTAQQERFANESHEDREARLLQFSTAHEVRRAYENQQDR